MDAMVPDTVDVLMLDIWMAELDAREVAHDVSAGGDWGPACSTARTTPMSSRHRRTRRHRARHTRQGPGIRRPVPRHPYGGRRHRSDLQTAPLQTRRWSRPRRIPVWSWPPSSTSAACSLCSVRDIPMTTSRCGCAAAGSRSSRAAVHCAAGQVSPLASSSRSLYDGGQAGRPVP